MNNSLDIRVFKIISWILLSLALIACGVYLYAEYIGTDVVLPWQQSVSYYSKPLFLEYFKVNGEPVGFFVDQYINWQQYGVGNMQFVSWPSYVLLVSTLLSLGMLTTAITYFSRFWYLVATGVLILLILRLNLGELQLWAENGVYLALGLIISGSYFFHAIRPSSSLVLRFSSIGILILLYAALAFQFGETTLPGLTGIHYGLYFPVLLTFLFTLFVGGDNIYSIFKLTTSKGGSGKNNLLHFAIFGLIYIGILSLLFLKRRGDIEFELVFINPTVILIISTISAYLCIEHKLEKHRGVLPISLLKQWVLPTVFVSSIALLVFARITANDPLVEALEDAIVISHLSIGSVYFIGAFINFTPLIIEGLDAKKVYFKPKYAPGFLLGLASMGFLVALAFYTNFYPYYQLRAGYYNTLGDLSEKKEEAILAEQYYRQAVATDFVNFKSNIQTAKYDRKNKNAVGVIQSLDNTFFKNENAKGHTILSNYYNSKDQAFNSLFSLKEALQEIDSKELKNNLAFIYRQFSFYDSAYLLLRENWDNKPEAITKSNLIALSTELINLGEADSLITVLGESETRNQINTLALANINGIPRQPKLNLTKDTLLLQDDLFLLYNSSLNPESDVNNTLIEAIDYYLSSPYNNGLRKFLYLAKAIRLYAIGEVNQAFLLIDLLKNIDNRSVGLYHYIHSVWALQQGNPEHALEYLESAQVSRYHESEISRMRSWISSPDIPVYENPFKTRLEQYDMSGDSTTIRSEFEKIAKSNAFDEETTLAALESLQQWGATNQKCYEVLLEAWNINPYSVALGQSYILTAIETGISKYAVDGLERLRPLMPVMEFSRFEKLVDDRIKERRNQILD